MKVKRCSIARVESGMALACPVIKDEGQFFLAEGTVLTDSIIERLKHINVNTLNVFANKLGEAQLYTSGDFNLVYDDTLQEIKSFFSTVRYFKEVPLSQMKELVETSIDPLVDAAGVINHLRTIRRQDDYTFYHSLNVSVLAGVLGKWLGLSGEEMKDVILAGLLHDIGKTQIPLEILHKPGRLTVEEMESMKRHAEEGYEILLDSPGVSEEVLYGVLQHHERNDGSGYPYGMAGDNIHIFAKIIAVADIYDAMTSDRVYRKKLTPFDVVEVISEEMFYKLDPIVCLTFLNNASDYLIGTHVKLTDGRIAEVIRRGEYYISRPLVCTQDGEFIDLERNKDISISELIEN